ncbi:hypothetical protein [Desulfitobacterium hafniense]|uniref:hypothetical protein n=1 Tax=Desulfitobacterium hafniense TaxID=49338 RepID=UPI0006826EE2|nr:hypothetical protein [Desulfitobacterium hafniense]
MILTKNVLEGLQKAYRKDLTRELIDYLKITYGEEPFPYEYSEQDLYTQIQRDIDYYYAGKLVITIGNQ